VLPLGEKGKVPDQIPLFRGHTATVLDTDWNPFNDRIIASGSEDGKVFIWEVPRDFTLHTDAEEPADVAPVARLSGHARKVGQVLFNPAADNILASASGDFSIKLWDITTGQPTHQLRHADIVQSLTWNATGSLLATTSRDKKIRVWDVRQETPVAEHAGHAGAKNSRTVWMGEHNRFATTGFSRMSERQIALWEPGRAEPIGGFTMLDSISGVCMPFWGAYFLLLLPLRFADPSQMTAPTACTLPARATATSATTNTRTTSSSSLASTSRPSLSAVLPSSPGVVST
jgi:coronin-1B/1C/6